MCTTGTYACLPDDRKASAAIVEGEKPSPATAAAKELARYQPVFL